MSRPSANDSDSSAPCVVTINAGSSSIKFALFFADGDPIRVMSGVAERLGSADASIVVRDAHGRIIERQALGNLRLGDAASAVAGWIARHVGNLDLLGIGHRIVHGGVKLRDHRRINDAVLLDLRRARPLDPTHVPGEIVKQPVGV